MTEIKKAIMDAFVSCADPIDKKLKKAAFTKHVFTILGSQDDKWLQMTDDHLKHSNPVF